jgi:malate dehydrogenase (oxaloacetate-decarboxylating)(NADP+)
MRIVATGRSDYPNQVNNVLGFPFIFRGALDVRATAINEEMKIAAARAIAELAREPVPEEVAAAYGQNAHLRARLHHPRAVRSAPDGSRSSAVAKAAMDQGVAQKPIEDFDAYTHAAQGAAQSDDLGAHQRLPAGSRRTPKRVVFAEAENEVVLRAAIQYRDFGYSAPPVLVGRTQAVHNLLTELGRRRSRQLRDP